MLLKLQNINNIFVVYSSTFVYKLLSIDNKFSQGSCFLQRKSSINKLNEEILKRYNYCKNVIKNHFNKNLVMTATHSHC